MDGIFSVWVVDHIVSILISQFLSATVKHREINQLHVIQYVEESLEGLVELMTFGK
jgi:hypothetical protein